MRSNSELFCSFCNKSQRVVKKLIAATQSATTPYICDECIVLSAEILEDEGVCPISKTSRHEAHNDLAYWREQLLHTAWSRGVRVSHRPHGIMFDEQRATFLMSMFTDPDSGVSIGETVTLAGTPTPWGLPAAEEKRWIKSKTYTVVAFAKLQGGMRHSGNPLGSRSIFSCECTFAALLENEASAVGQTPGLCIDVQDNRKPRLFWTGCLEQHTVTQK